MDLNSTKFRQTFPKVVLIVAFGGLAVFFVMTLLVASGVNQ